MSVESARATVLEVASRYGYDDLAPSPELPAALDELIQEVQAEMPCYFQFNGQELCDEVDRWWLENHPDEELPSDPDDPCPSCKARAEKVKV